jgi:hypothetical protein
MRRSLATILSLPLNSPHTSIVRNMWTVNTQVITTAVWLLFELIFSRDTITPAFGGAGAAAGAVAAAPTTSPIDGQETEIRDLARKAAAFLHENENQTRSRIAKRGASLLNTLLAMDRALEMGDGDARFDFRDVVSRVEGGDRLEVGGGGGGGGAQNVLNSAERAYGGSGSGSGSIVDWLSRDAATWEDIMGALDGGTPLSAAWDG